MADILEFQGEHRFLSNFWPCEVFFEGHSYRSVEHAYQAAKTTADSERKLIRLCQKPGEAKRLGRKVTMRPDWDAIKLDVMKMLLRFKFENPELNRRLLSTGSRALIEGNCWNDTYWGVCRGRGANHLGRLLMEVRAEIAANAG